MKNNYVFNICEPESDREAIIDLFFAVKGELHLPDRNAVTNMVDLAFARGGVLGAYFEGKMVGALGYFFGDPQHGFINNDILFLYVGAILPAYRGTRLFTSGLKYMLRRMQSTHVTHIRLQAEASNPFTNKLYGRFSRPLGPGKSMRGHDVITYGVTIEEALASLEGRKRPLSSSYAATPHAYMPTGPNNRAHSV